MISNNSNLRSKSCQQNLRSRKYNQDKLLEDPQPIDPIVQSPIQSINRIGKSHRNVLNLMLGIRNNHVVVCPSMGTIAKRTNLSIKRVYEIIEDLQSLGFLNKIYDHFKSNIYVISSWFSNPKIRSQLKHILWSLRYVIIVPYLSTFFSEKDLRIEKCRQYYISYLISLNSVYGDTNMHVLNEHGNCKRKSETFQSVITKQKGRKMSEAQKGFNEVARQYLEAYPKEAVAYATKKIHGRKLTGNPWTYYRAILNEWCSKNNVEPNYAHLNTITGVPSLTMPITPPSQIAHSTTSYQKKEEKKQEYVPKPIDIREVPESTLDEFEKQKLQKKYNSTKACLFEAMDKYERSKDVRDQSWVNAYQQSLNNMHSKYPYLFGEMCQFTRPVHTPVYIANQIARIIEHPVSAEKIGYRNAVIYNWARTPYTKTGEDNEEIAISYIDKKREEFKNTKPANPIELLVPEKPKKEVNNNLDMLYEILKKYGTPEPVKNEPESSTLNEEDYDEVLD